MKRNSVFSDPRFEFEAGHIYVLDQNRLNLLECNTPLIIHGSRGTGKTTLLNALNWKEQARNETLKTALKEAGSNSNYLGIYLKLPQTNFDVLRHWENEDSFYYEMIFSAYFDLLWLEAITNAIHELICERQIDISVAKEQDVCKKAYSEQSDLLSTGNREHPPSSFLELSKSYRKARHAIQLYSKSNTSIFDVFKKIGGIEQIGEIGRVAIQIIQKVWLDSTPDFKIKICFDECESLDSHQIKILSTFVRLCEFPIVPVFSFIRMPEDFYTTLVKNLSISKADLNVLSLDSIQDSQFKKFAEGVSNSRIKAALGTDAPDFKMMAAFGSLAINTFIEGSLKASESPNAQTFLEEAKVESEKPHYDYYKNNKKMVVLPYYQIYLSQKIQRNSPENKTRRSKESQDIRKKMVAAYLSICNEFKIKPIYAGEEIVLQTADKSIRDYLWQIHEIFLESQMSLQDFCKKKIDINTQNTALKKASENKLKSIPSSPLNSPAETYKLVFGLGYLTNNIQKTSLDESHLKSPERGKFVVNFTSDKKGTELKELIINSAEAGYFKIEDSSEDSITFRVHTSLAAHFGFSYRGAYYSTAIDQEHLTWLIENEEVKEVKKSADKISALINSSNLKQLKLGDVKND